MSGELQQSLSTLIDVLSLVIGCGAVEATGEDGFRISTESAAS